MKLKPCECVIHKLEVPFRIQTCDFWALKSGLMVRKFESLHEAINLNENALKNEKKTKTCDL